MDVPLLSAVVALLGHNDALKVFHALVADLGLDPQPHGRTVRNRKVSSVHAVGQEGLRVKGIQHGADLLIQVISQRYERGSIVLTTNKPFKQWSTIFNNDSTIASAVLDRLLHHADTVVIEGQSYRMKDRIDP